MNVGTSLESAITSLQRSVENAKNVAAQITVHAEESGNETGSGPTLNSNAETVGQMVNVEA